MNELNIFNYENKEVRTVHIDNETWWVLKDVCDVLGLKNPTVVAERLREDEVTKFNLGGLSGETNIINESGLYNVIFRSDKPEAEKFRRWVTHEVLPSIRKHGAYMTPDKLEELLLNPDTMIKVLTNLKEEQEKNKTLSTKIEEDKPKVLFADSVATSKTSILIGELAKILKQNGVEMGQNRLFEILRKKGFLISRKSSDYNVPTQRSMELGLFEVKETVINHSDGHTSVNKTTKVTGKGQVYFVNLFLRNKVV